MVEFTSNGGTVGGYLATPGVGAGPALIVVQEWWGLVDHVKDVCERFAAEGFTALASDLYHGVQSTEPDEARKLAMSLDSERAARDLSGAVDFLTAHESVRGQGAGVVGFCMGGGLALWLGTLRPEDVKAVASFYGIPRGAAEPDWSRMAAAVQGHFGEDDPSISSGQIEAFEAALREAGVEMETFLYPNAGHAFFNDNRPEAYNEDAARQAWIRTLEFLRKHLG